MSFSNLKQAKQVGNAEFSTFKVAARLNEVLLPFFDDFERPR